MYFSTEMITTRLFHFLFLGLALLHVLAQALDMPLLGSITKPLLMPVLAGWLALHAGPRRSALGWGLLALGFSTLGDMLLMGAGHPARGFSFFLGGVAAFGLAQLAYIRQFLRLSPGSFQAWFRRPVPVLVLLAYLGGMLVLLLPHTEGPVRVAVLVYSLLLSGMVLAAVHTRPRQAFPCLPAGALLFLLSDSLLAFNRFYTPIPHSGFWIMATYLSGQYLLARGILDLVVRKTWDA